jgi:hypothetical protein
MTSRRGILSVLAIVAWAPPALAGQAPVPAPPTYAYREEAPRLILSWNCLRPAPGSLVLDGLAEVPVRSDSDLRGGQVRLVGLDAKGLPVSEAVGYLPPVLYRDQVAPFAVELPLAGREARVDLYYSFDYFEHNGDGKRRAAIRRFHPVGRQSFHWRVPAACPLS